LRAKSAMAEILVSDLCELSPALIGGLFSLNRYRPDAARPVDRSPTTGRQRPPG
jgi:hypothetical protein